MIRCWLKERIAEKEFREGRAITMLEIAASTAIHRMTLSRIANHRDYNPTLDLIDKLCAYFDCRIEQMVEYISDKDQQLLP